MQLTIQPFRNRAITTLVWLEHRGWTMKRYAINYGAMPYDESRFHAETEAFHKAVAQNIRAIE